MSTYAGKIKKKLFNLIHEMSAVSWLFAKEAECNFSRKRKLPFEKLMATLIGMGGGTLTKELLEQFKCSPGTVSSSAFIQQRAKLLPEALEFLFHSFANACEKPKLYHGYRLLAVDGSEIQIPTNPQEVDSHIPGSAVQPPYNLLHLDAIYDLCSQLYEDVLVHGKCTCGENEALAKMVDGSPIAQPTILIADRGYEAFNTIAHIREKGWHYLIRIRDINRSGILRGMVLPDTPEFDVNINYVLTRKQTNQIKKLIRDCPGQYHCISSTTKFDFLDLHTNIFYPLSFRIVRFPISVDSYEVVITNLPASHFPTEELKKLYALRWGIETSFRHLKYTLGLLNFHSRKTEYIIQEIFAKLIMYNFTEMITSHVIIHHKSRKYAYQANFSADVHICRQFLRNNVAPSSVEPAISKHIVPIRPGRSRPRFRSKEFQIGFFYRIA